MCNGYGKGKGEDGSAHVKGGRGRLKFALKGGGGRLEFAREGGRGKMGVHT